jgi:hypothetical protein
MINWKGLGRKRSWSKIKVLFWNSSGGTKENNENPSVRITGFGAEI